MHRAYKLEESFESECRQLDDVLAAFVGNLSPSPLDRPTGQLKGPPNITYSRGPRSQIRSVYTPNHIYDS